MAKDVAPLPGYQDPYGLLCAILQDATEDWRGEMLWPFKTREELNAGIGPEAVAWRARPGGQTIGGLLLHMIIVEVFWFEKYVLGEEPSPEEKKLLMWDEIDVDAGVWPEPPQQPLSWFLDLHDRYRARTLEAIKRWSAADALIGDEGSQRTPRWVLGHVIQHETYHGGQIVMLYDMWERQKDPTPPSA